MTPSCIPCRFVGQAGGPRRVPTPPERPFAGPRLATPPLKLLALLLAILPLCAQTPAWNAPSSGYLYDSQSRTVRPVVGFAGSAYLGPPVLDGFDWVSLAPNQRSALLLRSGNLFSVPDLRAPDRLLAIGRIAFAQQALWSSDSGCAVILARSQLVWLSNLATAPVRQAVWNLETRPTAAARWTLLAADSAAGKVLLVSSSGGRWRLWLASPSAAPAPIPGVEHPSAAAFASGNAALVADAAAHQILRIQNLESMPTVTPLFSSDLYLSDPAGIAPTASGDRLFVADRASQAVRIFDPATGSLLSELPTEAEAISLAAVSPGRFLLNAASAAGPLYFLDTGDPPRIFFIPRGDR